ncbi:MAG: tetraacyldisaccharide 4'-kinase [Pyrinomonadaceae bacterium]
MNLLAPIGIVYGRIMDVRNRLFDSGYLRTHDLGARTISIGNLTTGGTGKTPLVELAAEILANAGEKVCVLTRGYGRSDPGRRVLVSDGEAVLADAAAGGDEPVELARKLLKKAVVVADRDRVGAAAWAKERFGITTFVLDDGFQHRRVNRDLDIVCIDATNPCGNGRILPAGSLRESFRGLERADLIVITRSEMSGPTGEIESRLRKRNAAAPIIRSTTRVTGIVRVGGHDPGTADTFEKLKAHLGNDGPGGPVKVLAFCGLGNPGAFFGLLKAESAKHNGDLFAVEAEKAFPDHHDYSQEDIDVMEAEARRAGISAFLTTGKDSVKLEKLGLSIPTFSVEIKFELSEPDLFRSLVTAS